MSSGLSPTQIRAMLASDFEGDLARRNVTEFMHGLEEYLSDPHARSLPTTNTALLIDALAQFGQDLAGFRDYLVKIAGGLSVQAFEEKYNFTATDLSDNFLPFSNVSGLMKRPQRETDYTVFKSGIPLANGYDCTLVPGVGLQFGAGWGAATGVLFIHALGLRAAWKRYVFYGRSFEGAGNKIANLSRLGSDIYGQPISPLPTVTTNLLVFRPMMLTEGVGGSYRFSTVTGEPIVTFTFDIRDDQFVHFVVIRES